MAAISSSVATLRFFGDDLDPVELTEKLGCTPDNAFRKGDVETRPSGRERVHKRGQWRLNANDQNPGNIDVQIKEMLEKLTDDLSVWADFSQRFQSDIFIGLFMDETNEGIALAPQVLEMVGARGLALDFDIYGPTRDE